MRLLAAAVVVEGSALGDAVVFAVALETIRVLGDGDGIVGGYGVLGFTTVSLAVVESSQDGDECMDSTLRVRALRSSGPTFWNVLLPENLDL